MEKYYSFTHFLQAWFPDCIAIDVTLKDIDKSIGNKPHQKTKLHTLCVIIIYCTIPKTFDY